MAIALKGHVGSAAGWKAKLLYPASQSHSGQ